MSSSEALERLQQAFPGKLAYVQSMRWSRDGVIDEGYNFDVTVYGVYGDGREHDHITGCSSVSLAEAVASAIVQKPATVDAEAMFAGSL